MIRKSARSPGNCFRLIVVNLVADNRDEPKMTKNSFISKKYKGREVRAQIDIAKTAIVLGGVAIGIVSYAAMRALVPSGQGIESMVPVLGGLVAAALVPAFLSHQRSAPADEFAAFDLIADEVWLVTGKSHKLRYANAAATLRSGLSAHGQPNTVVWDSVPRDQHAALRAALSMQDITADIIIGQQSFQPIVTQVQGSKTLMLVLRDVTRVRADAAAQDDFISTVSHELRSPLTSIKGSMGLLLSNAAGELPKPARGLLEIAHRNAERLVLIINDILDLQKIIDGGMAFDAQDVDVAELVHEAIAASSLYLQRFDLEVNVVGADDPIVLQSDPNRIIQVLGNLLTNAAKFSKPHGTVTVSVTQTQQEVTISVRDEGMGIPAAEQGKIFERFADMSNSNRHKNGGTGLGLSICKAIIDTLGGRISFESVEGEGTTFRVCLPRSQGVQLAREHPGRIRHAG